MLPRARRLRSGADFSAVIRGGRRCSTSLISVSSSLDATSPARVGVVVSKAVGTAVVRNRVKRRLRALLYQRSLEMGGHLVVRAFPAAAAAGFSELGRDLDLCLQRLAGSPA